jgi:hypothetical protein
MGVLNGAGQGKARLRHEEGAWKSGGKAPTEPSHPEKPLFFAQLAAIFCERRIG